MKKKRAMPTALVLGLSLCLCACGGSGGNSGTPDPGGPGGNSIYWGPRLGASGLSPVSAAQDTFGADAVGAVLRAARARPNGASQSSLTGNGGTDGEMRVRVIRNDDGNLVYEVANGSRTVAHVPGAPGSGLALFTDLLPGIEPDLSSYPHELLGFWAMQGEAGAFWSMSPAIPPVQFGTASPAGTATYEGDAVGLRAADGTATKFLADVRMVADFDRRTVRGEVRGFRSLAGESLGDSAVVLGESGFPQQGGPFGGATARSAVPGSGTWGARWSDGVGHAMGGTFGFAADDGSVGVLGAFSACACPPAAGGNPDEPVATSP